MNKKSHPWALMSWVETFPGGERGEVAVPYGGVLNGNDHGRRGERRKATHE